MTKANPEPLCVRSPLGLLKCSRALHRLPAGECMEVVLEDGGYLIDLTALVQNAGCRIIEENRLSENIRFFIRKPETGSAPGADNHRSAADRRRF